ncbi:MAG: signal peptidase II, partial [Planctomycetota bacterium]
MLLVVLVVGLAADLWTKHAAWEYFVYDTRMVEGRVQLITTGRADYTVAENWLELTAVANQGAAMGLGQGMKKLFLGVSVVALDVRISWLRPGEGPGELSVADLSVVPGSATLEGD